MAVEQRTPEGTKLIVQNSMGALLPLSRSVFFLLWIIFLLFPSFLTAMCLANEEDTVDIINLYRIIQIQRLMKLQKLISPGKDKSGNV